MRFAWWGAEEPGLFGSQFYVDQLSKSQVKDIAVNLNFDMVGSPNYVRFVYDGDASDTDSLGSSGSGAVEDVFLDYFSAVGLAAEPTAFDGRSDYDAFISVGIPAGGLFTGAEDIKTAEEEAIYGGTAGVAYDACYHKACDTIDDLSDTALDEMSDAAAHATLTVRNDNVRSARHGQGQGTRARDVPGLEPAKVAPHGGGGTVSAGPSLLQLVDRSETVGPERLRSIVAGRRMRPSRFGGFPRPSESNGVRLPIQGGHPFYGTSDRRRRESRWNSNCKAGR